jgi:tetratricopeptide (TPR) repeat protein
VKVPQKSQNPSRENVLRIALVAVAVICALLAALRTVGDFDAGWQIAMGRYVVQHHAIPSTDVLSYTGFGQPWIYPIFSGVLLYVVFAKLSWAGLSWVCALMAAFVASLITRRGSYSTVVLAVLAIPLIADRATPRADLFTLVLLPAFLLVLLSARESNAKPWTLPLLMILWVNAHPGFIFGLALLGWYVVAESIDREWARLQRNLPWIVAALVATLLNPWGVGIVAQWGGIFLSPFRSVLAPQANAMQMEAFIGEFSPTRFSPLALFGTAGLLQGLVTWFIVIGALGFAFAIWRRRFAESLLLIGGTYGAFRYLRLQALAAIVIAIVLGRMLDEWLASESTYARVRRNARIGLAVVTVLVAIAFSAQFVSNRYYVMSSSISQFGAGESWWFPERAAKFLQLEKIPGQLFHEYNVGGYVTLRLAPEYPDYIDGRGNPFGPQLFIEQALLLAQPADSAAWQQVADKRSINALMFSLARFGGLGSVDVAGFCRSQNWRPVYLDEVSMIVIRNTPQNQPWIDRSQVDCVRHDFGVPTGSRIDRFNAYSNQASILFVLGRDEEAFTALGHAEELYPYDPNVHLTRGQIFQSEGKPREAEVEYREAIDRKQTDTAWMALGTLLAAEGKLTESRDAMQNAAKLSPHPQNAYKALGQLSNAVNDPDSALKFFDRAQKESPYKGQAEILGTEFYAQLDQGRADSWRRKGDSSKAVEFMELAVRRTPMSQKRWVDLARLYEAAGRQQQATEAMQHAQQLAPAK